MWKGECFPNDICKKLAENKRTICEKIYVWDKKHQYFVSLTNKVLNSFNTEEYENIRNKKLKVLVSQVRTIIVSFCKKMLYQKENICAYWYN